MLQHLAWPRRVVTPAPPHSALTFQPSPIEIPVRAAPAAESGYPVYVVEPDRSVRIGLSRDLSTAGFEARPFSDAADLAAALPELAPGCVILDIAEAASAVPPLREPHDAGALIYPTIIMFACLTPQDAIAAVRLGAADLLRRPVPLPDLVAALRRAEPKVRDLEWRCSAWRAKAAVDTLTPREREVMESIMLGLSNKEMARTIGISPRTVEMHRARLYRRLRVDSLAELLALAWCARAAGA